MTNPPKTPITVAMTVLKNIRHEKFAQLVASGKPSSVSYAEAYGRTTDPVSASDSTGGGQLIAKLEVAERIKELREQAAEKAEWTIADALIEYRTIANADVNEVVGTRVGACRYCFGEGHQYHWKEREYLQACRRAEQDGLELPDIAGGFGYRFSDPPHPACPECEGEGVQRVVPTDTRNLSPIGKLLYEGVKMTANGPEIKIADRAKAREQGNRIKGAFIDRREVSGPGGVPINVTITPDDANL